MSIEITFELSEQDIQHFAAMAREAKECINCADDAGKVAAATRELLRAARESQPPEFILSRLEQLGLLTEMLEDDEWQLSEKDLERIMCAMAYFVDPEALIANRIPGIGFLDDAIMVELIVRDLEPEIAAYKEFCTFRSVEEKRLSSDGLDAQVSREDWLADKRAAMHARMRERRHTRSTSGGWKISLW